MSSTSSLISCLVLLSLLFLSLSLKGYRYPPIISPVRGTKLQVSTLHDWLISQGAKDNDIKLLFETPVRASSAIKKGDVLFSIPLGSCIEAISFLDLSYSTCT